MALDSSTISSLKQLVADAPRGPWRFERNRSPALTGEGGAILAELRSAEAGAFIVAAREALPALLQENELLVRLVRQHIVQFGVCLACGPVQDGHALQCPARPFLAR